MKTISHIVSGKPIAGISRLPVFNPATGEQTGEVASGGAAEIAAAVEASQAALPAWAGATPTRRTKVMYEMRRLLEARKEELARAISAEHGKTHSDALGEIARGQEVVEFACGIPQLLKGSFSAGVSSEMDCWDMRQPLGVVAGITPFNFPVMVPLWMIPMALACGNAFILKPSERDPSAPNLLHDLWREAGLPGGVLNVVHGGKTAVDAILDHPGIAAVSFVGLDAHRPICLCARLCRGKKSAGARRRQESFGRDARRRSRPGSECADGRCFRFGRRALHGRVGGGACG